MCHGEMVLIYDRAAPDLLDGAGILLCGFPLRALFTDAQSSDSGNWLLSFRKNSSYDIYLVAENI